MTRRAAGLAAAAIALLAITGGACAPAEGVDPRPLGVDPGSGYVGVDTRVVIRGEGFSVRALQPAAGGAPAVDDRYRAWLGGTELGAVTRVDVQTLHATVPAGLPAGSHDLEVEGPFGRRGRLERAFTVAASPGGVLQVAVSASRATVTVGQPLTVTASAANSGHAEVRDVVPDPLSLAGDGGAAATVTAGPVPASAAVIRPGEGATFAWTLSAASPGDLDAAASVAGTDSFSGEGVRGASPSPVRVRVQRPPVLSAEIAAPPSVATGTSFTVAMTVANAGEAPALAVAPGPLALAPGSVAASPSFGPFPAAADVAAGGAATFTWTWVAGDAVGALRLTGAAAGRDGNAGTPVSTPAATSGEVVVGRGALRATLEAAPASVAVGGPVTLTLRVSNPGTAPVVSIVPDAPGISGTGQAALAAGPVPPAIASLAPGESGSFTWTYTAGAPGSLGFSAGATGTDGLSGASVGASASLQNAVTVAPPPTLAVASFSATPAAVPSGAAISVALTLANGTGAAVDVTSLAPSADPPGGASCGAPAPAPPLRVAAGGTASFAWTCAAGAAGTVRLGAAVGALQAGSGADVGLAVPPVPVAVGAVPLAVASFLPGRTVASTGQPVALSLDLRNVSGGPQTVTGVVPTVAPADGATCTSAVPAPPQAVAAGAELALSWSCTASLAGTHAFSAGVSARDAAGADASPAVGTVSVSVQAAARVEVAGFAAVPSTVARNVPATVTLTLRNAGEAAAAVTGVTPTISPSAQAVCTAAGPVPPQALPGGASLAFSWTCTASRARTYSLGATVAATDANSGASVAPAVPAVPLVVR